MQCKSIILVYTGVYMPVSYTMVKNPVPRETENKYLGRVSINNSFNKEDLIKRMLNMGTSLTASDLLACFELFKEAAKNIILEGNSLNIDGFIHIKPSMSAQFKNENEFFDKAQDKVYAIAKISPVFNKDIQNRAVVKKIKQKERVPIVYNAKDFTNALNTNLINPGSYITLSGMNLKFQPDCEKEGVFIKCYNGNVLIEEIRVEKYARITNKEVICIVPEIIFNGNYNYHIELRTFLNTKSLRSSGNTRIT